MAFNFAYTAQQPSTSYFVSDLIIANIYYTITLPKAQRTRGLSSYHKFLHKSWSNFNFTISKSQSNISISDKRKFKILTKPSFRVSAVSEWLDSINFPTFCDVGLVGNWLISYQHIGLLFQKVSLTALDMSRLPKILNN